mmetsp:Transcript_5032/g.9204  ORF Transcript_5032/g.9204 Transcript_5032/m.9204 type:complete len:339 (+) Transcript_5032:710-1726(+)
MHGLHEKHLHLRKGFGSLFGLGLLDQFVLGLKYFTNAFGLFFDAASEDLRIIHVLFELRVHDIQKVCKDMAAFDFQSPGLSVAFNNSALGVVPLQACGMLRIHILCHGFHELLERLGKLGMDRITAQLNKARQNVFSINRDDTLVISHMLDRGRRHNPAQRSSGFRHGNIVVLIRIAQLDVFLVLRRLICCTNQIRTNLAQPLHIKRLGHFGRLGDQLGFLLNRIFQIHKLLPHLLVLITDLITRLPQLVERLLDGGHKLVSRFQIRFLRLNMAAVQFLLSRRSFDVLIELVHGSIPVVDQGLVRGICSWLGRSEILFLGPLLGNRFQGVNSPFCYVQ